ncbi:MAG: sigma-E processing peptidase SpoIIGA [Acutalibacteraceae bacterium]
MQVIYADVLVIVNIYINYILLRLCSRVSRREAKSVRLFLSSLLGGIYSLIILIDTIPEWVITVTKLAVGVVMLLLAFGFGNKRAFIRLIGAFLLVNIAFAGLMLALWLIFAPSSMVYCCGIVYFNINTTTLLVITVICYIITTLITKLLAFKTPKNNVYTLKVIFCSCEFTFKAFLDTGNTLTEPFSGYPVIIADPTVTGSGGATLLQLFDQSEKLCRIIPCSTMGKTSALTAFRPDLVKISGLESEFETDKVYIAFSKSKILNGDYTALLAAKLFENTTNEKGKDYAAVSENKT